MSGKVETTEHGPEDCGTQHVPFEFEAIHVYSWSAGKVAEDVPCTQVHLGLELKKGGLFEDTPLDGSTMIFRFRGPDTLDSVIESLIQHRQGVFGHRTFDAPPTDQKAKAET